MYKIEIYKEDEGWSDYSSSEDYFEIQKEFDMLRACNVGIYRLIEIRVIDEIN